MKNLLKKPKHESSPKMITESVEESVQKIEVTTNNKETMSGSFSKIDPKSEPMKKKNSYWWKLPLITLLILLILGGAITVFGILPAKAAYDRTMQLVQTGKELTTALKTQNIDEAKNKLPEVKQKLDSTKSALDKVYLLKLPVLNNYLKDANHGLNAAGDGLDALDIAINTLEPYADLLGLKGKGTFTGGSADQRIQLAVQTMDKMTPKIAEIGDKISKMKIEIDAIDPQRYPEKVRNTVIRQKLIDGKNLISETTGLFVNAQPLLEVLPSLLGEPNQKRYLVIFQNDKELRPTGGFMTAYAIFKVEHGKFIVEKSNDIYELDDQIRVHKQAPPEILTFHKGVYYFNIRDSNLSPDFVESVKLFKELYPNKWDFDGIVTVDTHVLVEAIKILGEFNIAGRKFSAETDKRCDCPGVIYELEDYATRPVAYVRESRKDILGELLLQIMKKALGVSPSQYWGQLFQIALSEVNQKHILANMEDPKAQKGIESLNMGGRIADGVNILGYKDDNGWDYLHINDANMAGAKSNLFVEHSITQDYTIDNEGTLIKTLTIDYKNPAAASNCNLEAGQLCLNGILRNWVRIYVPKGSTLTEGKGSQSPKDGSSQDFKTYDSLGKTVFEGFLTVRPQGSSQISLKYKLPFKKSGVKLNLLYQKQPGTQGHENTVMVEGKAKEKFNLTTDKVFTIQF